MITSGPLLTDIEHQAGILCHMAKQIDERGFCIMLNGMNPVATRPGFLYSFLGGGFDNMVEAWGHARGHVPLIIRCSPDRTTCVDPDSYSGAMQGPDIFFKFSIEKLAKLGPIHMALELVSFDSRKSPASIGYDNICRHADSTRVYYNGRKRIQLETIVNILSMPQHRDILTQPVRKPKKGYVT